MKKYIDADRLIRRLENRTYRAKGKFIEMINEQEAADVVEVGNIEHEMAVILAALIGCPCDYGDIGEALCEVCEIIKPGSYCTSDDVACWEQYFKHRKEVNE